ncbi:hypothetical protein ACH5RR_011872 [Cinchona calisaya]|uniref:J domain-containing protein n=1 Tax=Cinchona calisaya TaxID=153742 RepID=A0ABD3A8P0_9GENT
MFSSTSRPALQFSGESFIPPTSTSIFRHPRTSVVVSASATTAESQRTTSSTYVSSTTSLYDVLGIPRGATSDEIKAAYRRLAKGCHPDVAAIDEKSSFADEFIKVHAAYSTLSDPDKRADYDRRLFRNHRGVRLYSSPASSMSRFSGYSGRNWETDQCW